MRVTRWQSFNPLWSQLQQFQSEMNRLFDRWGEPEFVSARAAYPPVNMWDDGDQLYVEAELAGMDAKTLELHVTGGNQLTIKGQRTATVPEKAVLHRQERTFGEFTRVVPLPFPVNTEKVDATFENGVLLIKLQKHEAAKPRKISVKAE